MSVKNYKIMNFEYLLLEFYKDMNISENELSVLLMIEHFLQDDNQLVTAEMLAYKMNFSKEEIDKYMTTLYKKKYIEFNVVDGKTTLSTDSIKKILYKNFEKNLFTEEENSRNEKYKENKDLIFHLFVNEFKRDLTTIEIARIDDWLANNIEIDIIINSLKDAVNANKINIDYIDRLITKRISDEQ